MTACCTADAPPAAVAEYAATVSELLAVCSRDYQGMAAAASGHANDVRTLTEAWPANPTSSDDRQQNTHTDRSRMAVKAPDQEHPL